MSIETTPELKREIKELLISALKIPDVTANDIIDSESLFEGTAGVQIDSVDALEIVMALQKKYKVRFDDQNLSRFIIKSIDTIAEFVAKEQVKQA